jgi:Zn-finger nucleic acid-binding protein
MLCPNENIEMRQVKVESHYGQPVILDQCPECGGIWFDKMELYQVKQGEQRKSNC